MAKQDTRTNPYTWNVEKVRDREEDCSPRAQKQHDRDMDRLDRENDEKLK